MIFEDFSSAHAAILWTVFGIAFILGAVVNKTNFCTMGAVSDLVNMGDTGRIRAWIFAMAVAIIGVVIIESTGIASVDGSMPPYRGSNFAWLEYILGGILFGIGMTLGSGCGNKTLVRIGGGNLKSIFLFLVIAVCAYFMINPFPGTDDTLYSVLFYSWTSPTTASLATQQDLGSVIGSMIGTGAGITRTVLGLVLAAFLLWFVFKSEDFRGSFDNKLGGLVVGLAVLGAWYATTSMVTVSADGDEMKWAQYASLDNWSMMEDNAAARPRDVAPQSYTFINPIGQTLRYVVEEFNNAYFTFGLAAVLGVIAGSFVWAMVSRGFRIEWFASSRDFVTHLVGGVLMGIGGVLALGCTIGQAVTGISTLAMGSFLAFGGIVFGAAMTMRIQYYKLLFEDDATMPKAFVSALVDFKLLPGSFRKLESM
jgi:hypothetical protein